MPVHPKKVEVGEDFYHVRFREPYQFEEFRTPDWAAEAAASIVDGSEVVMGKTGAGNWFVQAVLIPVHYSDRDSDIIWAADEIQDKIEREGPYAPLYKQ